MHNEVDLYQDDDLQGGQSGGPYNNIFLPDMLVQDPLLEIRMNQEALDGSIYHGQYKSHYKHGYGILIKANGDKYDGYWHNN